MKIERHEGKGRTSVVADNEVATRIYNAMAQRRFSVSLIGMSEPRPQVLIEGNEKAIAVALCHVLADIIAADRAQGRLPL